MGRPDQFDLSAPNDGSTSPESRLQEIVSDETDTAVHEIGPGAAPQVQAQQSSEHRGSSEPDPEPQVASISPGIAGDIAADENTRQNEASTREMDNMRIGALPKILVSSVFAINYPVPSSILNSFQPKSWSQVYDREEFSYLRCKFTPTLFMAGCSSSCVLKTLQ